jgi:undecaprenyl-diphosphatase|tara:strand:+ start:106 stop:855 length:750 start_codon:yes stop_codon:yes gene_type:complete
MVSLIEAVILSIIQGITEWFPVSSSGHLALMQQFFGFQNLSYDVFLHFAGIFAVLFVFKREVLKLLSFNKVSLKYIGLLILALIPAGFAGLLLSDWIENLFSNMTYLGIFFIISGLVVYSSKFSIERKSDISNKDAWFIGLLQALAILPGISRSGMTISAGLFKGISKRAAIRFSFLMSIPLILGASVLKAKDLIVSNIDISILLISFIITFLVSLITIKLLIRIIKSDKFYLFGIYNILLGIVVLIIS